MNTATTLLIALSLATLGTTLLAGSAEGSQPLPCVIGHSYYSGCLVCVAPPNTYCACAPECPPPPQDA